MAHPLTPAVATFLGRLRFPTLFKLTLLLMAVSWLWPFDPIPLVDEIATALAVMVLSQWRRPTEPNPP